MKKTILAGIVAACAASAANAAPVQFSGNGHWYEFVSTTKSWTNALADASSSTFMGMTGHLVTITDAAENAFVLSVTNGARAWIGATDLDAFSSEGNFVWAAGPEAGTPLAYSNWIPGEPNNLGNIGEDFVEMRSNGQWNDLPSYMRLGYVVEYSPAPVPLPAGLPLVLTGVGALAVMRRRKARA